MIAKQSLQRLFSLVIDKIRSAEVIAENVALVLVDSAMSKEINFVQKKSKVTV